MNGCDIKSEKLHSPKENKSADHDVDDRYSAIFQKSMITPYTTTRR
jgi:hypothetical protein